MRSKQYSYLIEGEYKETIKCKGITKAVIKYNIKFNEMKNCLNPKSKDIYKKMSTLNNKNHAMYLIESNKKALSSYDDKRYICDDGIKTYPFGIESILKELKNLIKFSFL